MKNKGFTLIELSIVIVIIGLLIGGIIVANSMIESSRIKSFITQISQYDIAIMLFQENYGSLPGDFNMGETDGRIEPNYSFEDNTALFWYDLKIVGINQKNGGPYSTNGGDGIDSGVDIPVSALDKNSGIVVVYFNELGAASDDVQGNFYHIADYSGTTNYLMQDLRGAASPITGLALDQKLYDSDVYAGNVRVFGNDQSFFESVGPNSCYSALNGGAGMSDKSCNILIKLGTMTVQNR